MANKSVFWLIVSAVYTVFLLYFSLANVDGIMPESKEWPFDKLFHFVAYIVFGILWGLWYNAQYSSKSILVIFIPLLLFGIGLEVFQEHISPFRMFDWWDLLSNCLGTIVGTIIVTYYLKSKVKKV